MSHLFTCPHCQTQTLVDDAFSGHRGGCVECHGAITVPHFAPEAESGDRPALPPPGARSTTPVRRWAGIVAAAVVAVVIAGACLTAAVRWGGRSIRQIADVQAREASMVQLEKIALALNNYAADHGRYPPPVVRDDVGRPMHSWRVMLLPYLGEDELYNQYNRSLPWDHEENLSLQWSMPAVYAHPDPGSATGYTYESSYFLITGVGTLFPPGGPLSPEDVVDSPGQTILVAEGSPVIASGCWMEPIDLDYAAMTGDLWAGGPAEIGGWTVGGATVATVDGRGHFVRQSVPPREVRALVSPRGGEPLRDDLLD